MRTQYTHKHIHKHKHNTHTHTHTCTHTQTHTQTHKHMHTAPAVYPGCDHLDAGRKQACGMHQGPLPPALLRRRKGKRATLQQGPDSLPYGKYIHVLVCYFRLHVLICYCRLHVLVCYCRLHVLVCYCRLHVLVCYCRLHVLVCYCRLHVLVCYCRLHVLVCYCRLHPPHLPSHLPISPPTSPSHSLSPPPQPPAVENEKELEDLKDGGQVRIMMWLEMEKEKSNWAEEVKLIGGEFSVYAETVRQ